MAEKAIYTGTGRRKSSIARVVLTSPGEGKIVINGTNIEEYIPRESLITLIKQPLVKVEKEKDYDIFNIYFKHLNSCFLDYRDQFPYLKTMLKSEIAGAKWGINELWSIRVSADNQVMQSIEYFEEAKSFLN